MTCIRQKPFFNLDQTHPTVRIEPAFETGGMVVEHDGRIVWGPVWVHAECRTGVSTPYDHKLGNGFTAAWDHVKI